MNYSSDAYGRKQINEMERDLKTCPSLEVDDAIGSKASNLAISGGLLVDEARSLSGSIGRSIVNGKASHRRVESLNQVRNGARFISLDISGYIMGDVIRFPIWIYYRYNH